MTGNFTVTCRLDRALCAGSKLTCRSAISLESSDDASSKARACIAGNIFFYLNDGDILSRLRHDDLSATPSENLLVRWCWNVARVVDGHNINGGLYTST